MNWSTNIRSVKTIYTRSLRKNSCFFAMQQWWRFFLCLPQKYHDIDFVATLYGRLRSSCLPTSSACKFAKDGGLRCQSPSRTPSKIQCPLASCSSPLQWTTVFRQHFKDICTFMSWYYVKFRNQWSGALRQSSSFTINRNYPTSLIIRNSDIYPSTSVLHSAYLPSDFSSFNAKLQSIIWQENTVHAFGVPEMLPSFPALSTQVFEFFIIQGCFLTSCVYCSSVIS